MCQPKVLGFSQLIKLSILTLFSVFSSFQNITINTCFIKIRLTRFKPGSFGVGSDHCATPTTTCRFICSIWCLASCLKGLIAANAFTNQTSVFLKKFKLHSRHVTLLKRVSQYERVINKLSLQAFANIIWQCLSLAEKIVFQMFKEMVKPKLNAGRSPLDPLLLWPIGPEVLKKTFFKGKFKACSMYLHNLRSLQIDEFEGKLFVEDD